MLIGQGSIIARLNGAKYQNTILVATKWHMFCHEDSQVKSLICFISHNLKVLNKLMCFQEKYRFEISFILCQVGEGESSEE